MTAADPRPRSAAPAIRVRLARPVRVVRTPAPDTAAVPTSALRPELGYWLAGFAAHKRAEARRLRTLAAAMSEDVADLTRTLVRIGEASDWADARLGAIERDLRGLEAVRTAKIEAARTLEAEAASLERAAERAVVRKAVAS